MDRKRHLEIGVFFVHLYKDSGMIAKKKNRMKGHNCVH